MSNNPFVQPAGNEKAQITINKLKLAIKKYNINLWELFKKYDKSDDH